MAEINLLFELTGGTNIDQAAHALQERFSRLETVESAEALPEGPARITGVEVVAAIGVTLAIVKGSRDLIGETRKAIQEVKKLVKDYRELKRVWLEVGPDRVPLDELTDDHYRELAGL